MKNLRFLLIVFFLLNISSSYVFSSEIKNCKPQLTKFSNFKSDLIDCFNEENKVIDNNIIEELTDKPSSFFSVNELKEKEFFSNNQLSINKNFKKYFKNIVQENYQSLYGIQLELKSLKINKYISVKNYDEFIENSLEIFDSTISNNGSLNKSLGLVAAAALVESRLNSTSEDGKTIILSLSASSLEEDSGTTLTITATASESVARDTTLNLSFSGDATSGTDYSVASSSITILSGTTTGTTTISLTDDSVYEGNESISISTSSITGDVEYTSSSPTASFTILENESTPVITMSAASSTITENSGSNIVLTFTSSQVSNEDITISLSTSGTSTAGTDYSSLSNVTISANSTSNTVNFTPTDDSIYEGDETAIISIDTVSGSDATESASQSVTITITENQTAPTLTLTSSASSIAENSGSSLTLTATLSVATSEDVTVALAISGTATSGTDYSSLSNMTITSGQTTTTASFTPTDDNIYEGNETAIIDVDSVSGGSATESGTQQLTLTISDNESAPTVTLTSSASSVSEDGSAITLTATLSNATTADVTVTLSTGGTATEGTDYANLSDITVSAGNTTGTTSLTPTNDSTFEGDETITIDIDTVSGGSATENGTQQVSITSQEDDAGPTLTISDVTTSDESAANAQVTVTLSPASGLSATVDYATSDGTATAGSDYTSTSGTLTFTAGQTSKTINVPILADTTDENNETITLTLSNAVRATISDSTSTITITDDDSAPSLSINDVTTANETAGNATFTVSLSAASGKEITVAYATSDGTATAGSDYTSTSGTLTFTAGQTSKTFTVPVLGDSTDENNETVTLTLSSASNASISDATGTLTITDDDSAPSLSINDVSTSDESNTSTSLTVTLSVASGKDITVDYATSDGTATAGSDYTTASGTLTFSAGDTSKTIDITTLTASIVEGDETVTVTLSNASNASISDSTGTFTITDDDSSSFSVADITAAEDAGTATITVTVTNRFSSDVTIDYETSNLTATAGSDYTAASGTLTFSAGDTSKTFSVTISDDSTDENNETATITISNASNGSISDATATLTITDNDSAPSLSINDVTTSDESNSASNMTVTLSVASGKDITVDYATSNGTATAGSDYIATSGTLTISAGSTTGVIPITVLTDFLDEGNETLNLTLSNATNASISDGTGIFTITDNALSAGTTKTYNATLTSTIATSTEYTNIEALVANGCTAYGAGDFRWGDISDDSPYETNNLAEALGYGDYGSGQTIAIVDTEFLVGCVSGGVSYTHQEFTGKTIDSYGTIDCSSAPDRSSNGIPIDHNDHGTAVAAIAAGVDNSGTGILGVASQADLHISDYTTKGSETYYPDAWASATDDARADGAVVQNNSWGCDITLTAVQNYMTNNSVSASNATNVAFNSCLFTSNIAAVDNYVTALDDFQTAGGVIVYALSNNTSFTEADFQAALPELFTNLNEAWITAVNIDKTGSSGSYSYSLKSAPCGSTAEYCLGGDGWNITTAADLGTTAMNNYQNAWGTSFVAPQISGAVALLGNHFPNHTPEKLVDRLLASADNTWLTADGTVTFGNGVQHGYSDDYGHGLMDIYAALQPITTNSLGRSIYTTSSNNTDTSSAQSLDRTYLATSRSFGDSIKNAVDGKLINNFYDAMGMQFKYNVGEHIVVPESNTVPTIDLKNEMNKLVSADTLNNQLNLNNSSFDNIIKKDTLYEKEDFKSELAITLGSSSIPTQSFFNFDQYTFNGITDYNLPFLNKNDQGLSLNSIIELDNLKISFSTTTPMKQNDNEYLGNQKSLLSSLEYQFSDDLSVGLLNGLVNEKDNFLGLEGGEALSVNNSNNLSKFNSIKLQKNILEDMSLTVTGSYAISNFDGDQNSMISSADNIKSDSYSINFNKANLFKNDNFAFSISQPNRVYSGKMKFKLSDIVDYDGNIAVTEVPVDLKPSGRQLDTSASYAYDFSRDITLSAKVTYTNELNHIKDSEDVISSFIGLRHGNLKLGLSETDNFKDTNFMIDFKKQF